MTQPLRGAEKEGATGLIKGIGKGMAGLVLKPGAGMSYLYLHDTSTALLMKSADFQ